jgi:hypothetical protein
VTRDAEDTAIVQYQNAMLLLGKGIETDRVAAVASLSAVSDSPTYVAEPIAWRAYLHAHAGDPQSACDLAAEARRRFATWGTPWDKRLPLATWVEELDRIEGGGHPAQLRGLLRRT